MGCAKQVGEKPSCGPGWEAVHSVYDTESAIRYISDRQNLVVSCVYAEVKKVLSYQVSRMDGSNPLILPCCKGEPCMVDTGDAFVVRVAGILACIAGQLGESIVWDDKFNHPNPLVLDALHRVYRLPGYGSQCLVLALVYLDRITKQHATLQLTLGHICKLFSTGAIVASKFLDDTCRSNEYYARTAGMTPDEMNALELQFLFFVKFQLYVSAKEYSDYATVLMNSWSPNDCPYCAIPGCLKSGSGPSPQESSADVEMFSSAVDVLERRAITTGCTVEKASVQTGGLPALSSSEYLQSTLLNPVVQHQKVSEELGLFGSEGTEGPPIPRVASNFLSHSRESLDAIPATANLCGFCDQSEMAVVLECRGVKTGLVRVRRRPDFPSKASTVRHRNEIWRKKGTGDAFGVSINYATHSYRETEEDVGKESTKLPTQSARGYAEERNGHFHGPTKLLRPPNKVLCCCVASQRNAPPLTFSGTAKGSRWRNSGVCISPVHMLPALPGKVSVGSTHSNTGKPESLMFQRCNPYLLTHVARVLRISTDTPAALWLNVRRQREACTSIHGRDVANIEGFQESRILSPPHRLFKVG